jgi:GNAT superfamily N-acetyltransferase
MPLRPFKFPSDFQIVEQLTPKAYQYPAETGWMTRSLQEQEAKNFVDTLRAARRLWPLISLGRMISPGMRNGMRGFLWEEDGQPVGLVATGQGANRTWWIANLAVLPEYRRRGIARQLVQASIECARHHGESAMTLDVIAENLPAYQLYQQCGFEPYNGSVELIAPEGPLPPLSIPSRYIVRRLKANEWQPHFQVAKRITPTHVQKFRPITRERFQPRLVGRFINQIIEHTSGISSWGMAVYSQENQEPVASAQFTARTRPGGFHEFNIRVDPAHPAVAAYSLSSGISLLQEAGPGHPIHIHIYAWQESCLLAARTIGCRVHHTYLTMGMKLR